MAIRRIGVDGTVSRQSVDLLGNRRGEVQGFNVVERDDLRIGDNLDYLGRPAVVEVVDTEDLAQLYFMDADIGLDGIIRDETPGRGTDRPELIGRSIKGDGVNDSADCGDLGTLRAVSMWVKPTSITSYTDNLLDLNGTANIKLVNGVVTLAGLGSATVRTYGTIAAGGWFLLTVDFGTGISASACKLLRVASGYSNATLWDVQFFDAALTESECVDLSTLVEFALPAKSRVAWYNCESQHPTLLLDSSGNERHATCSLHTATVGNFFYEGSDVPGSYADKVGYTLSNGSSHYAYSNGTGLIASGVVIPRNEASQTACAAYTAAGAAVSLDNTGEAPRHARLENNNCGTFDGSDDYLAVAHLTGTETVVRSGGTSTPTVSAGRIDFTAGTCWDLLLSSGDWFPFSEGKGTTVHNVLPGRGHATANGINEVTFWGTKQNSFAYNSAMGSSRRTNYLSNTSDPTVGVGGLVLNATTLTNVADPWGTTKAFRLLPTNTNSENHRMYITGNSAAAGKFLVAYVKQVGNGTHFGWLFSSGSNGYYTFALDSAEPGVTLEQISDAPNGWKKIVWRISAVGSNVLQFSASSNPVVTYAPASTSDGVDFVVGVVDDWQTQDIRPTSGTPIISDRVPAIADSSGKDITGFPIMYAPSPGVWPLSEATLNSNPNNAPRRGTPGPTAFHPVSAPGSNPTFFRRRTKDSELVAIDRFVHYEETLDGARITKAQTFTTEKPL